MTFEPEHTGSILLYWLATLSALGAACFIFHKFGKWPLTYVVGLFLYGSELVIFAFKLAQDVFEIMNLAAYGVFIGGPLILASAAYQARKNRFVLTTNFYYFLALLVVSIGIDAFLVEPHLLQTTHLTMETSKLVRTIKIAVISDIQMDSVSDYERGVLNKVMAEKPDLILFPGHYVQCLSAQKQLATIKGFRELITQCGLKAPLGIFAVRGNAETDDWQTIFEYLPFTAMDKTTTVDLGPLMLTGLSFKDSFNPRVKLEAQKKFYIVFGHGPDFALAYPPADLLVAGHTHGGQVRLPFLGPVITLCRVPRAWAAGMTHISPTTTLVVSRGVGMERRYAPRLRFLCRPELIFITLKPQR